jgi:hypothetical protein
MSKKNTYPVGQRVTINNTATHTHASLRGTVDAVVHLPIEGEWALVRVDGEVRWVHYRPRDLTPIVKLRSSAPPYVEGDSHMATWETERQV